MFAPVRSRVSPDAASLAASSIAHTDLADADSAQLHPAVVQAVERLGPRDEGLARDLLTALFRNPNIRTPEWEQAALALLRHARDRRCDLGLIIRDMTADQLRDVASARHRRLICFLVRSDPEAMPHRLRELVGLEAKARADMETAVLKGSGRPYLPHDADPSINLNCKVTSPHDGALIVCETLHWMQLSMTMSSSNGRKTPWDRLRSPAEIAAAATPEMRRAGHVQSAHAQVTHFITDRGFGEFLVARFDALTRRFDGLTDEQARKDGLAEGFSVYTVNHAVNMMVLVKQGQDGPEFVVRVYDPNLTATHVRACALEARNFASHRLSHYMTEVNFRCYSESDDVYDPDTVLRITEAASGTVPTGPRIFTMQPGMEPSSALVFHLLNTGASDALTDVLGRIPKDDPKRFEILAGRTARAPGLFAALQEGHVDAILAYVRAVLNSSLSPTQEVELLAARACNGASGFSTALAHGHVDAILAFVGAVLGSSLSREQIFGLFSARTSDGTPGLFMALQQGHAAAVSIYAGAVLGSSLSPEQIFELFSARTSDGTPGLFMALQQGHAAAVSIYAGAVLGSSLSPEQIFELFSARTSDGVPGLFISLEKGHPAAVQAYMDVVLGSGLSLDQILKLLAARTVDDVPGLSTALENDHADAVSAYMNAVLGSGLSPAQKVELLAARRSDGVPGLYVALQNGHADIVSAYMDAVLGSGLGPAQKVELLAARDSDGEPGFWIALLYDHAAAVSAYVTAILDSTLSEVDKVSLLSVTDDSDASKSDFGIFSREDQATRAYADAIQRSSLSQANKDQ